MKYEDRVSAYRGRPRKGDKLRRIISVSLGEEAFMRLHEIKAGERSEFVENLLLSFRCPQCGCLFAPEINEYIRMVRCPACNTCYAVKDRKIMPFPAYFSY